MKTIALVSLVAVLVGGCSRTNENAEWAKQITGGGDPGHGRVMLKTYGCISCHTVDGIHESESATAPPLTRIARRSYLAGMLENTPSNMLKWIQQPRAVNPKTAMPNLNVTDQDARDMAAYLYTLK